VLNLLNIKKDNHQQKIKSKREKGERGKVLPGATLPRSFALALVLLFVT